MPPIPRRNLLKAAAATGAAVPFSWLLAHNAPQAAADSPAEKAAAEPVDITWLEDGGLGAAAGSTFGVPWPKGAHSGDRTFALTTADGTHVPLQTWATAYWPDGSLKWTAHAAGEGLTGSAYQLTTGTPAAPAKKVTVSESDGRITVDTGVIRAVIGKDGKQLVRSVTRGSTEIARDGRLVLLRQGDVDDGDHGRAEWERFDGEISGAKVEQKGPVRAVVRIDGKHRKGRRAWLPFSIRLYFYAGADSFRMVHTITFDGDQNEDFIRGLGVRFSVPMRDEAYDRHIRIAGEGKGFLTEAVKGVTGLRRDPGPDLRQSSSVSAERPPQLSGEPGNAYIRTTARRS